MKPATMPRIEPVTMRLTTRFAAPPPYVQKWLTDFREDDGRYTGVPAPYAVERSGHVIRRTQESPMGVSRQTITIESDDRWTCVGTFHDPSGNLMFDLRINEVVRPAPNASTDHEVEIVMMPASDAARSSLLGMVPEWERVLRDGFARMTADLRAAHVAGKAPTE